MTFIWPWMLVVLALAPLGVWLFVRMQRRRNAALAAFGSFGLAQAAARAALGRRRYLPAMLFLVGLMILGVALARPQTLVSLPRVEGTIMLVFDVSGSMAAEDIQPTRMEAAKVAAREFVQRQPRTVQIGVVAFSDGGLAVQSPTSDRDIVLAAINRLAPQRGTSLGQGILVSLQALERQQSPRLYSNLTPTPAPTPAPVASGSDRSAAIVVLTDGENNQAPDPLAAAQAAADRGVRIYTVGVGSPAGTTLRVNGFTVHTQLDERSLQEIAKLTEGAYYKAESQADLHTIYDNLDLNLVVKPETTEVTALFAGAGLLVLIAGSICSLVWFGRAP